MQKYITVPTQIEAYFQVTSQCEQVSSRGGVALLLMAIQAKGTLPLSLCGVLSHPRHSARMPSQMEGKVP